MSSEEQIKNLSNRLRCLIDEVVKEAKVNESFASRLMLALAEDSEPQTRPSKFSLLEEYRERGEDGLKVYLSSFEKADLKRVVAAQRELRSRAAKMIADGSAIDELLKEAKRQDNRGMGFLMHGVDKETNSGSSS